MPLINVAIPSAGRAASIRTPLLFPHEYPYHIVTHDLDDARWYARNPLLRSGQIHVSRQPRGIAFQRNWILDNLVKQGSWVLMLDDNIESFECVSPGFYNRDELNVEDFDGAFWAKVYKRSASWNEIADRLRQCIERAESIGAHLIGFATNDNYFFRAKHWRTVGFVMTKMALVKKTTLRFDTDFTAKDDYEFSACNLKTFGRVLINNFIRPVAAHYQAGGIGNRAVRAQANLKDAARLIEKYPELFRYAPRRNPPKSEVNFRLNSEKQVENWRKNFALAS